MEKYYTNERHIQILIYLLKAHGIKKIIASPGTTNLTFIGSIQNDPFFEIYSSVDERSAAYLACGLAAESGEPVVISCTGATASRNYLSGLTEAFYNKLPILAITSTQHLGRIGHNLPQVINRSSMQNDIVNFSKQIGVIHTEEDAWNVVVSINEALLELRHNGGGPVHLNVATTYSRDYSVKSLPKIRVINRICYKDKLPTLKKGQIGIFVGEHTKWTEKLTDLVDCFCEKYNAVVFCDQTSNYLGKYAIFPALVCSQTQYNSSLKNIDILIHIGNVSGSDIFMNPKEVWRVNPDGKVRDTFKKLKYVFEMEEEDFFEKYVALTELSYQNNFYTEWKVECKKIESKIPELPFSNVWIAQNTIRDFPEKSFVYYAILNTLRSWNYFEASKNVTGFSNTGGFGIDGGMSTLIGASFANRKKIYFCIVGDLGFFYDMNVLGNRHVQNNIRILLINNGRGTEFTNYNHPGFQFGEQACEYIAAAGHFGNKSNILVKNYSENLGFEYFSAKNKEEYLKYKERFLNPNLTEKPMIFEVFTDAKNESDAVEIMHFLEIDSRSAKKNVVKNMIGEKNVQLIKKIIKR